jgi:Tol biopolymer transport system component
VGDGVSVVRRQLRPAGTVVGAVAVAWLLLVSTVTVSLRVPELRLVSAYPDDRVANYISHRRGAFAPLSDAYVRRVLGGQLLASATSPPRAPGSASVARGGLAAATVLSHAFTNDNFDQAVPIASLPFTARTDTTNATRQPGEPADCARTGGTAWYAYSPATTDGLRVDTFGTKHVTALGVYAGSALGALRSVGCNTDAQGNAQVGFLAERGKTYYFQVAGPAGGGPIVFHAAPIGATTRVSVYSNGDQAGGSFGALSDDGRYVLFQSANGDLDPDHVDPRCNCEFQYVRDLLTAKTTMVTVATDGTPGHGGADHNSLSADGRFAAYDSSASTLVPDDTNGAWDVFVHDRVTGKTTRESVSSAGAQGDSGSYMPHISADGRFVLFQSYSSNLNPCIDPQTPCLGVFLRDRLLRTTTLVSVTSSGVPMGIPDTPSALSPDGRYAVFESTEPNTPEPRAAQTYVRDLVAKTTTPVSVSPTGALGDLDSIAGASSISANGRFVSFISHATNLVPGDTNASADVFVRDLATQLTERVSVAYDDSQALDPYSQVDYFVNAFVPVNLTTWTATSLSADGRLVAFDSAALNLIPGDTNARKDVFVHDRRTHATIRASVSSTGAEAVGGDSFFPKMSADGTFVAFVSRASNLVEGDDNGRPDVFFHILAPVAL